MACGIWLYKEWKDIYVQYEHIVYIWHLTPTYCDASLFVYDLMHTVHKFRLCISDMISMSGRRDSRINIHPNVLPLWAISIELLWEWALFKTLTFYCCCKVYWRLKIHYYWVHFVKFNIFTYIFHVIDWINRCRIYSGKIMLCSHYTESVTKGPLHVFCWKLSEWSEALFSYFSHNFKRKLLSCNGGWRESEWNE